MPYSAVWVDRGISEGSLSFLKNIEENIKFLKGFQNSDEFPRGTYKNMLLRGVKLEDVVDRGVDIKWNGPYPGICVTCLPQLNPS